MSARPSLEQTADQTPEASRPRFARIRQLVTAVGAWANAHRWKAVTLFGGAFAALLLSVLISRLIAQYAQVASRLELETALAQLDAEQYEKAINSAQQLCENRTLLPRELGGPLFVLGAATAAQADSVLSRQDKNRMFLLAARYLEEARGRGLPDDRRQQGLFLLGKCLHESQQFAQSLSPLKEALAAGAPHESEIQRMLSSAYLSKPSPDPQQAYTWSQQYLNNRALAPERRAEGLLHEARIVRALGEPERCRQILQTIPPSVDTEAESLVIQAQLAIDDGDRSSGPSATAGDAPLSPQASAKYQRAIDLLRQAQTRQSESDRVIREAAYLLGVALQRMNDTPAARAQFARTSKLHSGKPAGVAAGLAHAELLLELGDDVAAAETYGRSLHEAGHPERFHNPWISLDEFRRRVVAGYRRLLEREQFQLAIDITRDLSPLAPRTQSTELRAQAFRAWAEKLQQQATLAPESKAGSLAAEARDRHRHAGQTYATLAKIYRTDRLYPEHVWNGAESYLQAHDYEYAVNMFREYLACDSGQHRARALVGLGEVWLALDRPQQAIESLLECIELHAKDPASYRARLLGSAAYVEMNEADRARQMLLDNLHHEQLTPRSLEWRDSLFALGKMFYTQGSSLAPTSLVPIDAGDAETEKQIYQTLSQAKEAFGQANHRLEEFVARYPEAPQVVEARYLIANAHWQSARLPHLRLDSTTIEATRVKLHKQIQHSLGAALTAFSRLQEILDARQDTQELSAFEKAILRNSYFAQGGILFDVAKVEEDPALFEEAIQKYSSATNRYQHEPASLEAFVQIASCYRRLGRLPEARGTIEQARMVLQRMPAEAPFNDTTRYDRDEWISLLDWLASI